MSLSSTILAANYAGNNSTSTPYPVPFSYLDAEDVFVDVVAAGSGFVSVTGAGVATFTVAQEDMRAGHQLLIDDTVISVVTRNSDTEFILDSVDTRTLRPFKNLTLKETLEAADYAVTADGVTTTAAIPINSRVTVYRRTPLLQPVELPLAGKFPATAVETALDRLTMQVQELASRLDGTGVGIPSSMLGNILEDTAAFTDAADRAVAVPKRVGQLGLQVDTGTLYRASSVSAGAWLEIIPSVVVSEVFEPIGAGTTVGENDGNYLATASNSYVSIPSTAKPGFRCALTSDCEGTVKFTLPSTWRAIYPDGTDVGVPVANGQGSRIVAEVVQPGIVRLSGELAPEYWNWHPTADSGLVMVCKAGVHSKHSRIGYEGSVGTALGTEYIPRWGSLFGSGALIYAPTSASAADFMPKIQDDVNFLGRRSFLLGDGTTAREYSASVLPTGNSFSMFLALRCLVNPTGATSVVLVGGEVMDTGLGWPSNTWEGLNYINATHRYQAFDNGCAVAYGVKPAAAGLEETTDTILLSVERSATGVWTVYSGETLVSEASGTSAGLTSIASILIKTGVQMQLGGWALHTGVPATSAARILRQKYYRSLFIA